MPAYSTDKGFTGSTKDKEKNKSTSVGAGTKALSAGAFSQTQPRDPAGPRGAVSGGSGSGPGMKAYSTKADRGGGTTTQDTYSTGAVPNYPNANAAAIIDQLSSAIPGMGLTNTLYKGAKALAGDTDPLSASNMGPLGDMLGGDPGPQRGYQPDRYRGAASLTGIGGSGGAVNAGSDREIPGRSYNAAVAALVGDIATDPVTGETGYRDDIMLQDRRRPYDELTPEQKRKQLLAMV